MESTHEAQRPHVLRDYVLLADGWRGAMVNPEGEISWLCFPTWADPAVFAGLLGSGGWYQVAPAGRHVHGGWYEDGTLIWRQRWVTGRGVVEVRDALAYPGERDRAVVLRRVSAVDTEVLLRASLTLGPDYGRREGGRWTRHESHWLSRAGAVRARWSGVPEAAPVGTAQPGLAGDVRLEPGEVRDLVLELSSPDLGGTDPPDAEELWRTTERAWANAVPSCDGVEAGDDARRAFAVLRGLTTPDGATVAAATTALPERAEAGRNYDYRYAWIRDTCYIGQAGAAVKGAEPVLDGAVHWVTERLLADGPRTRPAYQVDGAPVPEPQRLGLPGYPGGSDVVGNRVGSQFQLDLFGESLLLLANAASVDRLEADGWRAAEVAVRAIEECHGDEESGIWEIEPDRWTHSRLICVAGLRALAEQGAPARQRTQALALADRLLSEADRTSLHPTGRWQRAPGDERVDASLLLAEIRGALTPEDPRSVATREAILGDLCQEGFLYRYAGSQNRLGEDEGAFLVCNFWMALAQLRAGEVTRGAQWFERTRGASGSSGLFSEEYDVAQRQLRGNIPQAFVHALLIETAAELARA